jgi:hypothetical protein
MRRAETCFSCRFWNDQEEMRDGDGELWRQGECRRRAPTQSVTIGIHPPLPETGLWPTTLDEDWCGEFEPNCK